jgi:hypothetical protein
LDEARGIATLVGNQEIVLGMCSARVLHIHLVKHW